LKRQCRTCRLGNRLHKFTFRPSEIALSEGKHSQPTDCRAFSALEAFGRES
jgi:hypothetical protein